MFMANTKSATLSIRLKPEIKRRLAKLAQASGRSSNFLIADAVESYVADQERMLESSIHKMVQFLWYTVLDIAASK